METTENLPKYPFYGIELPEHLESRRPKGPIAGKWALYDLQKWEEDVQAWLLANSK